MANLPLRNMVLYKHGVGYFVRAGDVSGEGLSLSFRAEEINDVLKSLAVFDRAGGQILGIDYQTPMDKAARLASISVQPSDQASQRDLLRDLRGRDVTLTVEATPGSVETISGRVIGVDIADRPATAAKSAAPVSPDLVPTVALLDPQGEVRFYRLDALRSLHIHDPETTQDLSYFLDTSRRENNQRSVHIRLSEGDHELVVQYVAPSPTWRVSYRVIAETDESGGSGRALLQGWGLFDNRLEEDLDNVSVTLVAGQPISFIYDLYASRIPARPIVRDESRVAPGPIKYAGAMAGGNVMPLRAAPAAAAPSPAPKGAGGSLLQRLESQRGAGIEAKYEMAGSAMDIRALVRERLLARLGPAETWDWGNLREQTEQTLNELLAEENIVLSKADRQRLRDSIVADTLGGEVVDLALGASSVAAAAEGGEAGEFFEYRVTAPVSVKRGDSALVPILSAEVSYQRELLYNGSKLPGHPVAALRFKNTTGLTLESGPATLNENGDYRGEAVIPFTKDGHEIYLPYAVELGVTISEDSLSHVVTTGLGFQGNLLVRQQYQIQRVKYEIENTTANDLAIVIEAPIPAMDQELFETTAPDVETATERRWRVDAPARKRTSFLRQERRRTQHTDLLRNLDYKQLQLFLEKKWLDQHLYDTLAGLLELVRAIERMNRDLKTIASKREQIFKQQSQLRENFSALQASPEEASLRSRLVGKLEETQNRLDELEAQEADLDRQILEANGRIEEMITSLPQVEQG